MDKLLQPDIGLMIWTAVTFLLLVLVLTKAAWKPILEGLNKREGKIRSDLERAETSQKEAETLRLKYETQLAEAQRSIQDMVSQAKIDGEKTRFEILSLAKTESDKILEMGRQELAGETEKLRSQLRREVGDLSVAIAEKILERSIDKKVQETVLKEAINQLSEVKK